MALINQKDLSIKIIKKDKKRKEKKENMEDKNTNYIMIKEQKIPIKIRNYCHSNSIKIYFKEGFLHISKSTRISQKKMFQFIKQNEEKIFQLYEEILKDPYQIKKWKTGEIFFYEGEKYQLECVNILQSEIQIKKDKEKRKIQILIPSELSQEMVKPKVDQAMKKYLKEMTQKELEEKLPQWSQKTRIQYTSFQVRDATSKYGSCIPSKKALHFSSRLMMLPEEKRNAIMVHELCHIVYPNHSQDFYQLVKKYIPNYGEINQWLKRNNRIIQF